MGTKFDKQRNAFNISAHTTTPINIQSNETYDLEFKVYYNCYDYGGFFLRGCEDDIDKLIVLMKTNLDTEYKKMKEFILNTNNSTNYWKSYNVEFLSGQASNTLVNA